ncbi:MAG: hypothetical protein EOM23_01975 [Candidatus Moranbacteria bacterium]|nr:hypothetical protein [Candidatus Moranbacteria bacterium]
MNVVVRKVSKPRGNPQKASSQPRRADLIFETNVTNLKRAHRIPQFPLFDCSLPDLLNFRFTPKHFHYTEAPLGNHIKVKKVDSSDEDNFSFFPEDDSPHVPVLVPAAWRKGWTTAHPHDLRIQSEAFMRLARIGMRVCPGSDEERELRVW